MAFDAGMMRCALRQIEETALGARIEKVCQPEKDEIILQMRSFEGGKKLLINAGSANPRIGFSDSPRENPAVPPMLCMLLRKYLTGAKLAEIEQPGFDRVAILKFETHDEMGFACVRYLIAEIMGKYSNLIFADDNKKIIASLRTLDIAANSSRSILPGFSYELPANQGKTDPLTVQTEEAFTTLLPADLTTSADKWILSAFGGVSPLIAREIVYRASGKTDTPLDLLAPHAFYVAFADVFNVLHTNTYSPCIVKEGNHALDYSFLTPLQYPADYIEAYPRAGEMLDAFFSSRDHETRIKQRASDLCKLIANARARLTRKLEAQRRELADGEKGQEYKTYADLITANIHRIKRGDESVVLTDYGDCREDGSFGTVTVKLDSRLSPAANAQRFYKKYTKCKNAVNELTKQILYGEEELQYIESVAVSLEHAETLADMTEIREELAHAGYASRMKNEKQNGKPKPAKLIPAKYETSTGKQILCGKNNLQNDYITCRLAEKKDYWFHVKGAPGSHVLLICNGEEPEVSDFTEAAEIAAFHSSIPNGNQVAVDYTYAKNVKKPAGAKPGFVIYSTNYTAYVTPDEKKIAGLRRG